MADPYGNLAGTFSDLTRNLLTLKGQQMQQALGAAELGMRERGLNETARQHNVSAWGTETAPPAGTATLQARQVQTAEQEHAITAAKTPHLQNFDSISAGMITNQLGKFGINDKDLTDTIRTMGSTPGVTKQQAMQEILTQYPNYRGKLIQDSVDTLLKNSEKDPNYVNTPQGLAHQKFIGMLDSDTTGEGILGQTAVFGPVQRALKMEDQNNKAALLEQRLGFQNELLQTKFDQWKEVQGIKFDNAQALQDAKYAFLKDLKVAGVAGDAVGRKILANGYQEQLRSIDRQIGEFQPWMYPDAISAETAKAGLTVQRDQVMNDLKELSGVAPKTPKTPAAMDALPAPGQNKDRTVRDTVTGKRYRSDGTKWNEVK